MRAVDRAVACVEKTWGHTFNICVEQTEAAIRAALDEEREAIAALADDFDIETYGGPGSYERPDDGRTTLRNLAAAVRARKGQP